MQNSQAQFEKWFENEYNTTYSKALNHKDLVLVYTASAAFTAWQAACRHKDAQHKLKVRELKELLVNLLCGVELIKAEHVNLHPMFWVKIEQNIALAKKALEEKHGG